MRIYRPGPIFPFDFTVSVKEFKVSITDNVMRKQIGDYMKVVKLGDPLWQCTAIIKDQRTTIETLKEILDIAKKNGYRFNVTMQSYEPLFGPEFVYSGGLNLMDFQIFSKEDEAYNTGNIPDGVKTEYSFTFGPTLTPYSNLAYNPTSFPETVFVQSVSRVKNTKAAISRRFHGQSENGFGVDNPVAIVTWQGTKEEIAKAKCYLLKSCLYSSGAIHVGQKSWFFLWAETNSDVSVYLLALDDHGPISIGSDEFSFSATIALARA